MLYAGYVPYSSLQAMWVFVKESGIEIDGEMR